MSEKWLFWRDGVHDPFFNMAIDQLLLEKIQEYGIPLLRTYRWDRPSVSIGCSQIYPEETAKTHTIVRRPTGGGNVWHDRDLTYTVVIPPGHRITELDRMASYRVFHEAMLPMLVKLGAPGRIQREETPHAERATMKCFVNPSRFDLMAEDGAKFAGAAQRRSRCGILHQGSILLEAAQGDWNRLDAALLDALAAYFKVEYSAFEPEKELITAAEKLAENKYSRMEWNRERLDRTTEN